MRKTAVLLALMAMSMSDVFAATGKVVTTNYVKGALESLDAARVGGDGSYIQYVSETDGIVSAIAKAFDTSMSGSSTNAVQNKVVNTALGKKQDTLVPDTNIKGSGSVTVTKGTDGVITVSGTDNNTTYTAGTNITISNGVISAKDTVYTLPEATSSKLGGVKVDTALSSTSTNPVQNKVVNTALNEGLATKQDTLVPDTNIKGSGSVTVTKGTDGVITVSGTDNNTTYTAGTNITISNGVISAKDTVYTLPEATSSKLGGVKVDTELSSTSTNPVQNKAVNTAISNLQTAVDGKQATLSTAQLNAVNSGITAAKVSTYDSYASTIAGKQAALSTAQLNAVNSGITAAKLSELEAKQGALTETQLNAVNSGITAAKVSTYDGYSTTISGAVSDAATAKSDAATAKSDAATAKSNAATALTTANTAKTTAEGAVTTANTAKTTADNAAGNASTALQTAQKASKDVETLTTTVGGHTTSITNLQTAVDGKQAALSTAQLNAVNSGITAAKLSELEAKQGALTETQLNAVNSGITAAKVSTYDGYASTIAGKQATLTTTNVTTSGGGNVVTAVTASNGTVTVTKGTTLGSLATKSAVGSSDITDGSVATADIANGAVTAVKTTGLFGFIPSGSEGATTTATIWVE